MSPSPCNADELADRRDAMRADIGRTTIAEEQEVCRASFPRPNVRLPNISKKARMSVYFHTKHMRDEGV